MFGGGNSIFNKPQQQTNNLFGQGQQQGQQGGNLFGQGQGQQQGQQGGSSIFGNKSTSILS